MIHDGYDDELYHAEDSCIVTLVLKLTTCCMTLYFIAYRTCCKCYPIQKSAQKPEILFEFSNMISYLFRLRHWKGGHGCFVKRILMKHYQG